MATADHIADHDAVRLELFQPPRIPTFVYSNVGMSENFGHRGIDARIGPADLVPGSAEKERGIAHRSSTYAHKVVAHDGAEDELGAQVGQRENNRFGIGKGGVFRNVGCMPEKKSLRVLVLGSGGREHALVKACLASDLVADTVAAPGNGGMALEVPCHAVDIEDNAAVVALAQQLGVNFVIVGPEVPLANGVVDALEEAGIPAYGPRRDGARLEASKAFTKDFLLKYGIPTAAAKAFRETGPALDYIRGQGTFPVVIKADGLAAGKGVLICNNESESEKAVRSILDEGVFGESGQELLVEEFMSGEEASVMAMVSGEQYVLLPFSQDHKRAYDADAGPNTGGMGAYAPAAVVTPQMRARVEEKIVRPTLAGLRAEGIDYRGTLYIGIMLTREGPKVVEFNVRFGDPECQVLLPLCRTDPVQLMYNCAEGTLVPGEVEIEDAYAMVVVLAAGGYPDKYKKGEIITLPASTPAGTSIVHAGTKRLDTGEVVTAGGRVLGVVAKANTLREAAERAYGLTELVRFGSCRYRRDIGHRQLARE